VNKQYPNIICSGAGTAGVNGTYNYVGIQDFHPKYVHTSGAYKIITDTEDTIWEIRTEPGGVLMYDTPRGNNGVMDNGFQMFDTPDHIHSWNVAGGAAPGPTIVPDVQGNLEVVGDIHATAYHGDGSNLTGLNNANRGIPSILPKQNHGGYRAGYRSLVLSDKTHTLLVAGDDSQTQLGRGANGPAALSVLKNAIFRAGDQPINGVSDNLNNFTDTITEIQQARKNKFVLTGTGILYAAGDGAFGQCGQGTTNDNDVFKSIRFGPDAASNKRIVKFSVGASTALEQCHVIAIDEDGQVWGFGYNGEGQLGFGDLVNYTAPQKLSTSGASNAATFVSKTAIECSSSGDSHGFSYVIFDDNTIWSTGDNQRGQLGLNDTTDRNEYQQLSGITDAMNVWTCGDRIGGATYGNAYYLATDNKLYGCGDNADGQIGDGTTIQKNVMTLIKSDVGQFAVGAQNDPWCIAIDTAGTSAHGWGDNQQGQLGDGTTVDKTSPTSLAQLNTLIGAGVKQIICAGKQTNAFTAVLDNSGNVFVCGDNANGQLGDGSVTDSTSWIKSLISNPALTQLFYSGEDAEVALLGLTTDGVIYGQGWNASSLLVVDNTNDVTVPTILNTKA
jgi:alpha-tubulin suppressor-like RCC1 family protein